mmetsp:Transcript_52547/g.157504  ORF Transcript_52547/g.157504 Transcript_52547/m.157504 type:complete len:101 (-) Transcript_52547:41-343(-)
MRATWGPAEQETVLLLGMKHYITTARRAATLWHFFLIFSNGRRTFVFAQILMGCQRPAAEREALFGSDRQRGVLHVLCYLIQHLLVDLFQYVSKSQCTIK